MKSLNFEFLRPKWPELAGLGGFAEAYAHPDPVGSISKLRVFCEQAQMQKLLGDLENERSRADQAEATAEERQAALQAAMQATEQLRAIDPLAFNEEETRKYLIDQMLADEGWDVGKGLTSTAEVVKEAPVKYQVGTSGEGRADYVLDDDNGKPLGVVEAKKTARDPQLGRKQAEEYADGLEKEHGQRPVIFYTNGYDLWIWNDAVGEPPRKIYGFYAKDRLQHIHIQRSAKKPVSEVSANPDIAGRMYQIEAVRRVVERFAEKKRKALLVQATGTGKTRVAISMCDAMIKANWAKRILFLCDRRELRRQANNAFNEFLPSLPRTYVTGASAGNTKDRIFLSTYPAMMKVYQSFDVGFFDLIIADESHRSLYNRYRQLFEYFDCYQLGLTATPVDFVSRNTFKTFECDVGSRIGKTIVFARSIRHARLMEELFNEMYPQYGGKFCQTIVSDDPRAESLIDDFKGDGTNPDLTVAISVDMLDTPVDVPECVNLVFAKPVYSYVKFWQMIGRGTRLCPDLFGPDLDKSHFQIFDHWGNFERFEQDYKKAEPTRQKSLCERVFEARMKLAEAALEKQHNAGFEIATGLISKQIADLPRGSIPIKEKWPQVQAVSSEETVRQFDAATKATLDQNETLRKIRLGEPVTENDLEDLCSLVLTQEPGLDRRNLMEYFQQAESLDQAIREIIGMDADAVHERFTQFVQAHPNLA